MKKIYYLYGFILLVMLLTAAFILFPASFAFNYYRGGNVIVEAFQASGAKAVESNINVYSTTQDMFLGKEELTGIVKVLADEMGMDANNCERNEQFGGDYNQVTLTGDNDRGHNLVIIGHSVNFNNLEGEEGVETNIVMDISVNGDYEDIAGISKKAEKAVEHFIKGARVTSCIVGSYEDRVPASQATGIISAIMERIHAREVENAIYDDMISVSGYTPKIADYLKIGEDKVNINIAMRYNSYEGKTYIWIGSPVISLEY